MPETAVLTVIGGTLAGAVAAPLAKFLVRKLTHNTRKSDAEVAAKLRDDLVEQAQRLLERVDRLDTDVLELRGLLRDCEERSAALKHENEQFRLHSEERTRQIKTLQDQVARLEAAGCPALLGGGRCEGPGAV